MTIALTGATGFVGQAVLDEAERRGVQVQALTRRPQPARKGVTWVAGSLDDRAGLDQLADGTDAMIHVAGLTNAPDAAGFRAANVAGTGNVMAACENAGVGRFVFVSSLSAREPRLSDYGASKAEAEVAVEDSTLDWTIVRPPAVYGPRDGEMFELFRAATFGVVPLPPRGRASMIEVSDLARLLVDLALRKGTRAIYEPDDGHPGGYTHAELARLMGAAVGRRAIGLHMPGFVLKAAARADRAMRGSKAKLTPDRARYMVHRDWVCDPARAVPANVWKPRIPAAEGFPATARWYREAGWL